MKFVVGLFLFLLISGLGGWWFYLQQLKPVHQQEEKISVIIPKGASATKTAEILDDLGLIRSTWAFRLFVKLNSKGDQIRAGQFSIPQNWSVSEIVDFLGEGGFEGIWVTIPEGWRREQIAIEFNNSVGESFDIQEFLSLSENLEGKLFPDTYLVPAQSDADQIIEMLNGTFEMKIGAILNDNTNPPDPLTVSDVLVMASILEREAANNTDYAVVAGILLNRLRQGWPVQADATLQYAKANLVCNFSVLECEDWWPTPLAVDKDIDSPYNSYINSGLPPAPIASPGVDTVQAVLSPVNTNYMFYITDNEGYMHYAESLGEHNENVEKYLR